MSFSRRSLLAAGFLAIASPANAQLNCAILTMPSGAEAIAVQGHSVNGPRCFDFTPGDGKRGSIVIENGNGTLSIEGLANDVRRFEYAPGPWTYFISVVPDPIGGSGGPFEMRITAR